MSNQKRFIPEEDAKDILGHGSYGILCTASPDGEPYGIPVNYYYAKEENCIFFHCALSGRKMDNMKENNKVSFTVVGFEKVIPHKTTTHYESAIAFGNAEIVSDETQKIEILKILSQKYGSDAETIDAAIAKYLAATTVVAIHIEKISGKRNNG